VKLPSADVALDDVAHSLLQQWFSYSNPTMEEELHDVPLLRQFAGLDAFEDETPDESSILRFCHLLEQHDLATAIFAEVAGVLY
jgi:IS5 family transposase